MKQKLQSFFQSFTFVLDAARCSCNIVHYVWWLEKLNEEHRDQSQNLQFVELCYWIKLCSGRWNWKVAGANDVVKKQTPCLLDGFLVSACWYFIFFFFCNLVEYSFSGYFVFIFIKYCLFCFYFYMGVYFSLWLNYYFSINFLK